VAGVDAAFRKGAAPVKLGKPRRDEFFRINPDPDYIHDYPLLIVDDGKDKEMYLVVGPDRGETQRLREMLEANIYTHRLFVGINRHDTLFVWPVRLYTDSEGGPGESWSESALERCEQAKSVWIKIRGDRSASAHSFTAAEGAWETPNFGALSFRDIVEKAFKGKVIDRVDHPAIENLFMRKTR